MDLNELHEKLSGRIPVYSGDRGWYRLVLDDERIGPLVTTRDTVTIDIMGLTVRRFVDSNRRQLGEYAAVIDTTPALAAFALIIDRLEGESAFHLTTKDGTSWHFKSIWTAYDHKLVEEYVELLTRIADEL